MCAELLLRCPLFKDFTPVGLEILGSIARLRVVLSGQSLFSEGSEATALYVLVEGRLQIRARDADGREVALGSLEPFEALGQAALLSERAPRHLCTALAEGDCRVLEIGAEEFRGLLRIKPQACTKLLLASAGDLAARVVQAHDAFRRVLGRGLPR